jgi:phage major head subunit gpT-like protein
MNSGVSPKYIFYVEAESREALEAAVAYVMRRLGRGFVGYACGMQACLCEVEVEYDGNQLTVKTCTESTAYAVIKLLVRAYAWLGGKAIQVVRL